MRTTKGWPARRVQVIEGKKFILTLIQQFCTHTPLPNKLISLIFQYQTQRKATTVGLKMQGEPSPDDIEKKYLCVCVCIVCVCVCASLSLSLFSLSLSLSLCACVCARIPACPYNITSKFGNLPPFHGLIPH